jgi:TetR/AcrR family transcriptional regulator, regulator of autoinduction and epiphytic fitness
MKTIPAKRKYDSTRRQQQARETRLKIAQAARPIFMERGYNGTTIDAIATQAGVASETIYAIFRNKRNILSFLFDISIGGDDQPIRLIDRPEPQAVLNDSDPHHQITRFAADITEILSRAAPVFEIMRVAAKTEPEIARLVQRLLKERMQNMTMVAKSIAANSSLREGLDQRAAAETIWLHTSPELYQLCTVDLGWDKTEYADWLKETLARLLLP